MLASNDNTPPLRTRWDFSRICVFGAGATGGHLAARLARARIAEVSVVARGEHLAAIKASGLRFTSDRDDFIARPDHATADPGTLQPQDLVLVTLKAHQLPDAAKGIGALMGRDTIAVFLVNGIPWWWRHGGAPSPVEASLPILDPAGALFHHVGPDRSLGAVVHSANVVDAPGAIRNRGHNRFLIGEPADASSERVLAMCALLNRAGIEFEPTSDLRREVWRKLLVNASGNPVSALTRLDSSARLDVPAVRELLIEVVTEVLAVGAAHGCDLRDEIEPASLVDRSRHLVGSRPSMLQDVLAGRTLEVDAILGQVVALGAERCVPTPTARVVLALLQGLAHGIEQKARHREGIGAETADMHVR